MCTRLNNLNQSKEIVKFYYQDFKNTLQLQYNSSSKRKELSLHIQAEIFKLRSKVKLIELKIDDIENGLLNLLVTRFNLFCKKAKGILFCRQSDQPISLRVKPLVSFLKCNFDMMKKQLYPNLFNKFIKLLWNAFYEVCI